MQTGSYLAWTARPSWRNCARSPPKGISLFNSLATCCESPGNTKQWRNVSMASLRDNFDQLFQRLRYGRGISNTGDDPVYYLVFPPHEMLEVKRQLKEWEAKLKIQGWRMETFSMAEAINDIFQANEFRDVWLASEMDKSFDPDSVHDINQTLSDVLVSGDALMN